MRAGEVARRRIRSTGLVGSSFGSAEEVVRWHGAVQAQDYVPTKWSLAQRAPGLTDQSIDDALADGAIVRTHVLRPTWHFVARDDVRWLLALTGPIVQRGSARRRRDLNLDAKQLSRAERVITKALEGGGRLTRDELGERLAKARIDPSGQRLPHILMHCELEAVICSAGLDGKRQTYGVLDERVPPDTECLDPEAAAIKLTGRYLRSHGPAAVEDLRWWSSLPIGQIRPALEALRDEVRAETVDGTDLWMRADEPARAPAVRGVHLLPTFDELIVGYQKTRSFGDPRAAQTVAPWKDRVLRSGVILADGRILGLWRRITEPRSIRIEVHSFDRLDRKRIDRLEAAGRRLGRFVGTPVSVEAHELHPGAIA
jgi:DNA glycosylase AlkZ-like